MNQLNLLRVDLTPAQIILSFLIAIALGFIWATVYRKTHTGVAYTRSFYLTLIMIAPIVAAVMMAIGSNVALSLGLVGALSIIRFRAVIKDPKDMVYLFMSIAIGLTAGANAWLVGISATFMIGGLALLLSRVGYDRAGASDYVLIFRSDRNEPWRDLTPEAQGLVAWKQLRSATDIDAGNEFEYTYSVRLADKASPERVVTAFSNGTGAARQVALIAPENHLDL